MADEREFKVKITVDAAGATAGSAQAAQGLKDISGAATDCTTKQVEGNKKVVEAEKEAFTSKGQLKNAIKGLQMEFPLLGQVARMALNPITLVVAGLASAWSIWTSRVQGAVRALGGVEMPDFSASTVGRVNAMAEAWMNYADAVDRAVGSFNSVEAAFKRKDEQEEKELARKKKLIEAQQKAGLLTEEQAAAQLLDAEEAAKAGGLARRDQKVSDLVASSKKKMAEAAAIKVASPEDEARIEGLYKLAAEDGAKKRDELMADIADLNTVTDGGTHPLLAGKIYKKHGIVTDADALEIRDQFRGQVATIDANAQGYRDFVAGKPDRARLRARKEGLTSEAGAEIGAAAAEFGALYEPGGAIDQFGADSSANRQVASVNLRGALSRAQDDQAQLLQAMLSQASRTHEVTGKMAGQVKAGDRRLAALEKAVREMEGRPPRTQ